MYLSFKPSDSSSEVEAVSAMQKCIRDVLIIGTRQQLSKVSIQSIKIGQTEVSPVASARNLGTWFNTRLDMRTVTLQRLVAALSIIYTIYVILGNIYPENQLRN